MNQQAILKMGERGQVVIPKKFREAMGLDKNSSLKISMNSGKDRATLIPIRGFAQALEGTAKDFFKDKNIIKYIRDLRADKTYD